MLCLCAAVLFVAGCGALGETLLATAAPQSGEAGTQVGPSPAVDEPAEPSLDAESGSDSSVDSVPQPGGEGVIDPETDSGADSGTEAGTDPGTGPGTDQAADGVADPGTEPVTDPGVDDPDPEQEPEPTPLEQARLKCEQLGLGQNAIDATFIFAQAAVDSGFTVLQAIEFVRTPCVAACADALTICELACTDCATVVIGTVSDE